MQLVVVYDFIVQRHSPTELVNEMSVRKAVVWPPTHHSQPNFCCRQFQIKRKMLLLCDQHCPSLLVACRNTSAFLPDWFLPAGQSSHALPQGDKWVTHYTRTKSICIFLVDLCLSLVFPRKQPHTKKGKNTGPIVFVRPQHFLTHYHTTTPMTATPSCSHGSVGTFEVPFLSPSWWKGLSHSHITTAW